MEQVECIVVGAGVVGLAVARVLARTGREVIVIEAERGIGTGVSSRSSEVIHAGIYYPTGLTKSRLCVEGKEKLYAFCCEHHVPHRRVGKLLVATSAAELPHLEAIRKQAVANGVNDLVPLTAAEARDLEPALECVAATLSPSTGIIDSHAFMFALQADAEAHGAMVAFETPLITSEVAPGGIIVETGGASPMKLKTSMLVNAAGLGAQGVARSMAGMAVEKIPPLHLAKGNYYALARRSPFSHLIYPMPSEGGLGVHLTLDMGGQARFGPDIEWIDEIDYQVNAERAGRFYAAIRRYWPELREGDLLPAYAGIRPKIERPGGPTTDFMIHTAEQHGIPNVVHLFGIESPGLTSALAIAEEVAARLSR
ncbi:NAD(P)/FAD-dependent oxidoreductase [Arvimicrobium flavum]|uniref:NAD(P)/FAD-dependent oxidoreductase n=1 Tax=Arvimicrobium flavum TaxID=3393320 RepID=UPI00237AD9CC|nr:NAD(P)/FAD-dependent oxidoreductase [Mesorhizobium shangrilense]